MNQRKETTHELKWLRKIVDTVPAIIYIKSKATTARSDKWMIEWMNPYGLSLLGYSEEDLKQIDSDIYSGSNINHKAECIVSLKTEKKSTIREEAAATLWRFYTPQSNEPFYCWEQSEALLTRPGETTSSRVVIGHIFTPNQLNRPQLSMLLRQIHCSRYQHHFDLLTRRETEIMKLILKGNTCLKIAELLGIKLSTVQKHRDNMMQKLGARNAAQLAALTMEYGIGY